MAKRWMYAVSGIDYATGRVAFGRVLTTNTEAMAKALSERSITAIFGVPMLALKPSGDIIRHAAMHATVALRCRQRWNRKRRHR